MMLRCRGNISTIWSKLNAYYVIDWALVLGTIIASIITDYTSPFQRQIVPHESISYPHSESETIPTHSLYVLSALVPALLIIVILKMFKKRTWKVVHLTILALFISIGYTYLITNILKLYVGRFRPDFMSRCHPLSPESSSSSCSSAVSVQVLDEGRKSFPSGHSSMAFSGLGYLSIFLIAQTKSKATHGKALRVFIIALPLMGAALIGISRLTDYLHHWDDIAAGSILGLSMAYCSYRQLRIRIQIE